MNLFNLVLKLTVQIFFVIIFISTLQAKNIDKFNRGDNISDYFSGILLLNENQYDASYKFLKKLDGLEESHLSYSQKYLYSLINSGKFNEAFNYAKKIEKRNLDSFESNLIVGVYYLKNEKYDLAQKYFLKIKNRKSKFAIKNFVANSLLNWTNLNKLDLNEGKIRINSIDSKFENLKKIQNTFLHCYYKSQKTGFFFEQLTSDKKIDFSRYNYFYAKYLVNSGKINKAKEILNSSLELYPKNLVLKQYKLDLNNRNLKIDNNFNCQNQTHVISEILYIVANVLSSQSLYNFSNFYLNLAKYLNEDFHSFNTLLAENFLKINNLDEAKKIYTEIGKQGSFFLWYATKKNAQILIKEEKEEKAIKLVNNIYKKFFEKGIYEIFDYAEFLKNNDQFENSIIFYTKIIESIKKDHPLYPEARDGRGVAYERIGMWKKAEKDLLVSLEINPDQAYVINYLAYTWIEKGKNIEQSLKMLKKANNLKSNDPYIIDSLGWALFKLQKYKESKNYLQLAVQLMPADPVVNDHYGDALWKNGNKIQARYYWKYVLNLKDSKDNLKENINNKLISGL